MPLETLARTILEAKRNREVAEARLRSTPRWRFRQRVRREHHVELRRAQEQQLIALLQNISKRGSPKPRLASRSAQLSSEARDQGARLPIALKKM
jgi:hypothetical protein